MRVSTLLIVSVFLRFFRFFNATMFWVLADKCLPRLLASPLYGFSSHGSCRPAGKSHPDRLLQSWPVVGDNDTVH